MKIDSWGGIFIRVRRKNYRTLSTGVAGWVPATFGVIVGVITVGLLIDLVRRR